MNWIFSKKKSHTKITQLRIMWLKLIWNIYGFLTAQICQPPFHIFPLLLYLYIYFIHSSKSKIGLVKRQKTTNWNKCFIEWKGAVRRLILWHLPPIIYAHTCTLCQLCTICNYNIFYLHTQNIFTLSSYKS